MIVIVIIVVTIMLSSLTHMIALSPSRPTDFWAGVQRGGNARERPRPPPPWSPRAPRPPPRRQCQHEPMGGAPLLPPAARGLCRRCFRHHGRDATVGGSFGAFHPGFHHPHDDERGTRGRGKKQPARGAQTDSASELRSSTKLGRRYLQWHAKAYIFFSRKVRFQRNLGLIQV